MKDGIISWKAAGVALGLLLIVATYLVKPLGVSTQFVVSDAAIAHKVNPEFAENNTYLKKYGEKENWGIGYGWMLVFGMLVGGGATAALTRSRQPEQDKGSMPELWEAQFGPSHAKRYAASFVGGALLLF